MNGGKIVYVPIRPPAAKNLTTHSAAEWKLDIEELKSKVTARTKIIVLNTPHNPLGKVFSKEELEAIGKVAIEEDLLIVSDEVVSIHWRHNLMMSTTDWIISLIIELQRFHLNCQVVRLQLAPLAKLLDVR